MIPPIQPPKNLASKILAPQGVRLAELLAGLSDVCRVLRHQRCGVTPGAHGQHDPARNGRLTGDVDENISDFSNVIHVLYWYPRYQ